MQDLGRRLPLLTSNELNFEVKPADAVAEAVEADTLEKQIRAAPDQRVAQALADRLQYLPGDAATNSKLSLFLNAKTFYPFGVNVVDGLWIARNRKLVCLRLEQALVDLTQTLSAGTNLFGTTVALESSFEDSPTSALETSANEARLCHLLAATLSQRTGQSRIDAARTVFVTLISNKQIGSPDFESAREILINHFNEVDQYNVDWLLNSYGNFLDDHSLNSILLRMLDKPNVSRAAILHYLGLHDALDVRPVIASELCATRPPALNQLSDTSIETIPEADGCLLDRIHHSAALPNLSTGRPSIELQNRVALAARFASPAIYDSLLALYTPDPNRWPLPARGYALAYFSKWRLPEARPLLDAALPPDAPEMDPNIMFALSEAGSPVSLLAFFRDRLNESLPGQVEAASYYISQHGLATDRDVLRVRLERWHAQWLGKDIPSDQARLEAEITSFVASGVSWQSSVAEREAFRDGCLTQMCRDRFPTGGEIH